MKIQAVLGIAPYSRVRECDGITRGSNLVKSISDIIVSVLMRDTYHVYKNSITPIRAYCSSITIMYGYRVAVARYYYAEDSQAVRQSKTLQHVS